MSLATLAPLLQRAPLDRKTKLQILAILAENPSDRVVQDIETLVAGYETMDRDERGQLAERLLAIETAFEERVKKSTVGLRRDFLAVKDEVSRTDEIERIRQSIMQKSS